MSQGKIAIIGGSRGLGNELLQCAIEKGYECLSISRTAPVLSSDRMTHFSGDLSCVENLEAIKSRLEKDLFKYVFYVAGGGPYGPYFSKQWKDHRWALQVTLMSPLELLHSAGQKKWCEEFVCIGSSIAEARPDPHASSYCAAKHGIKGALSSIVQETEEVKVSLVSPGYMDTGLLPPGAEVRQSPDKKISDPGEVAKKIWHWVESTDRSFHLEL